MPKLAASDEQLENTVTLINRLTKLFTADFHAVIDNIEEPETLLRQAVREMEEEVAKSKHRLARLHQDANDVSTASEAVEQRVAELDEELTLCFAEGRDALAKSTVKRKLEARQRSSAYQEQQQQLATAVEKAESVLQQQQEELTAIKQKVNLLAATNSMSSSAVQFPAHGFSDDEIEVAFLKERQRRAS